MHSIVTIMTGPEWSLPFQTAKAGPSTILMLYNCLQKQKQTCDGGRGRELATSRVYEPICILDAGTQARLRAIVIEQALDHFNQATCRGDGLLTRVDASNLLEVRSFEFHVSDVGLFISFLCRAHPARGKRFPLSI